MQGIVDRISPIIQFEHPSDFNFNGNTLGTTDSISVMQKSPQSNQAKMATSPAFVYVKVPQ